MARRRKGSGIGRVKITAKDSLYNYIMGRHRHNLAYWYDYTSKETWSTWPELETWCISIDKNGTAVTWCVT